MTKKLVALGAFVAAISLSILIFLTIAPAPLIFTTESADKSYVVHLSGRKSRPPVPIIEHAVYFDLFRQGQQLVRGRKLHTGDWFDPAFENLYPEHTWVNSSTLKFHGAKDAEGNQDTLNLTNNASKSIKFLQVRTRDLFLIFDLKPQARTTLSTWPQVWLSGFTVQGEFEDGTRIPKKVVEFMIEPSLKGPFTYDIAINDDGPTISSPQLPVYRPQ